MKSHCDNNSTDIARLASIAAPPPEPILPALLAKLITVVTATVAGTLSSEGNSGPVAATVVVGVTDGLERVFVIALRVAVTVKFDTVTTALTV